MTNMRKPVFTKEINMAKITSKDKVLLVGAGILPTETYLIADITKASVVAIDNCKNAVKHAKKYIKKKGLDSLVTIEFADGANFPVKDFDVIFIAINVYPIDSIITNISKNAKNNTKVLCKSFKGDIPETLKSLNLNHIFQIIEKTKHPKTESYLLNKVK
jgi:cyclopropane fatty-acyl-phospholipid synthase-like methyltransferase